MDRSDSPTMLRPGSLPKAGSGNGTTPGATFRAVRSAVALLPLAAAVGCQSLSGGGKASPEDPMTMPMSSRVEEQSTGSSLFQNSTPVTVSLPTDPDPLPELDSKRTVNVHLDLGRVYQSKGQFEAAEAEYSRALEAVDRKVDRKTQAAVHRRLAGVLDRQGKFDQSASHYEDATRLAPRDSRVWNDAGYSAYLQGDWDRAIDHLRKAHKLESGDPRILTNLGLALAASGRQEEAIEALTRAGGPGAAQANLAYILAATGQTEQARERYEEALRLNPSNDLARAAIGQLDSKPGGAEAIASRPSPVDPAVSPASFDSPAP